MANFTEEIKSEIMDNGLEWECCKLAFLSAFIRTSGSIISKNGNFGFEIVTENERTAEFLCDMLENDFSVPLRSVFGETPGREINPNQKIVLNRDFVLLPSSLSV